MNTRSCYCSTSQHVSVLTDDTSLFFIICIVNRNVKLQLNFEISLKVNHHPILFDTYLDANSVSYQIKVIRFICHNFFLPELSSIKFRFNCCNLSPNCFTSVFFSVSMRCLSYWLALKNTSSENVSDFFHSSLFINFHFHSFRSIDVEYKLKYAYKW